MTKGHSNEGSDTRIGSFAAITEMLDLIGIPQLGRLRLQAMKSGLQSRDCWRAGQGSLGPGECDETLYTTHLGCTRDDGILHSSESGKKGKERKKGEKRKEHFGFG